MNDIIIIVISECEAKAIISVTGYCLKGFHAAGRRLESISSHCVVILDTLLTHNNGSRTFPLDFWLMKQYFSCRSWID